MERRVTQNIYRTGNGEWLDGSIFYEHKSNSRRRVAKFQPTSEAQERLNRDNARRMATRLLQDNFAAGVDFFVHPTYDETNVPCESSRVRKDMRNFLLRVKRLYARLGIRAEFKYLGTAVGASKVRRHLHIVITGSLYPNLADEIRKLWPYGTCNVDRLEYHEADGFARTAAYICNNHFDAKDIGENAFAKSFCCSRNLSRPEPQCRRGVIPVSLLPKLANASECERVAIIENLFPGYSAVEVDVSELEKAPEESKHKIYGNYYIFLRMRRKSQTTPRRDGRRRL